MTTIKLSVIDQSPVISGHTPQQAIQQTIRLAQAAEQLGYYRYSWAEHHSGMALADTCPEILVTRLAAATSTLRIGTARGGDQTTAMAMGQGRYPAADDFPEQVQYLAAYLDDDLPDGHPFRQVRAQPAGDTSPQIWLLGSSDYSGALAAQLGLRFAFAHFISARGGDVVMRDYKKRYQPSPREPQPQALVCVFVICAETQAQAEGLGVRGGARRPATGGGG